MSVSMKLLKMKPSILFLVFTVNCLTSTAAEVFLSVNTSKLNSLTPSSSKSLNSSCLSGDETSSCPAWAYCNETAGICECYTQSDVLICDPKGKQNYVLRCYCLTSNEDNMVELGPCVYNCDRIQRPDYPSNVSYTKIPDNIHDLNSAMCNAYNRTGTLCGECLNDTFLRAYSYDMSCHKCDGGLYNWMKYIAVAYLPLTLFCIIVFGCRINIPSSQMLGYVFYCQILGSPMLSRTILLFLHKNLDTEMYTKIWEQLIEILYGIWNLDFFRILDLKICLKLSPLATLSLDFFIAIYPLVIMIFIYMLTLMYGSNWKIVVTTIKLLKTVFAKTHIQKNIGTSVIHAFAIFMFLSNVKFLNLCLDLLLPVQVCSIAMNGSCRWAVFYEPSIDYFSHQHLPYAALGLVTFFVFVLTPMLFLILYSFLLCQKCLRVIPKRWQITLRIFVDSFQGCFKDGTELACRDCRWFSVIPFLLRLIIFGTYSATFYSYNMFTRIVAIFIIFAAILTIIADPYKAQFRHFSDHFIFFLLFLACVFISFEELYYNGIAAELIVLAACFTIIIHQVYFFVIVFYWCKKK